MNMKKAILLIGLAALLGFGLPAQAVTIVQMTSNSDNDAWPQVSGSHVVWQSEIGNSWEIFLYDLSTNTPTRITNNATDDTSPQIDGNYFTWIGGGFAGNIYYYDISTGGPAVTVPQTPGRHINSAPQIANGNITWSSNTVGTGFDPGEIYLHRISTSVTTNISASTDPGNMFNDIGPLINASMVGWTRIDEKGTADPSDDVATYMIYDIATGTVTTAAPDFIWPDSPQADGNLSVYSKSDGTDREIFLQNEKPLVKQITNNNSNDTYPRISGSTLVWVGGKGAAAEIYAATDPDTDGDGVTDSFDNCTNVVNSDQRDTNDDGYGNICDADLNNDGITDKADQRILRAAVGSTYSDADLNGDGVVDNADAQLCRSMLGSPPGPSALAP